MVKEDVKEAYDSIAGIYTEKTDESTVPEAQTKIVNQFKSSLESESLVLDAGCGGTPIRIPESYTVGVDISRGQLEKIEFLDNTEQFLVGSIQGDISHLPFDSHIFDGVVAFYSLIHIPLEEHQQVCNEFYRVLNPDGYALITEGGVEWCGSQENWINSEIEMKWEMAGPEKTKKHLRKAGFEIIEVKHISDNLSQDEDAMKPFFFIHKPSL